MIILLEQSLRIIQAIRREFNLVKLRLDVAQTLQATIAKFATAMLGPASPINVAGSKGIPMEFGDSNKKEECEPRHASKMLRSTLCCF